MYTVNKRKITRPPVTAEEKVVASKRRKNDFYPTASWLTEVLLELYPSIGGTIFECCSGDLDMARVLGTISSVTVVTNDIDETKPAMFHVDATKSAYYKWDFDWIVTNPPFNRAMEILQVSYDHAKVGVAMLLRLSFLEPTKNRSDWLSTHPPTYMIVLPRHSFTGDGNTDSVTAAWMIWDKRLSTHSVVVVPRERKNGVNTANFGLKNE